MIAEKLGQNGQRFSFFKLDNLFDVIWPANFETVISFAL